MAIYPMPQLSKHGEELFRQMAEATGTNHDESVKLWGFIEDYCDPHFSEMSTAQWKRFARMAHADMLAVLALN